MRNISVYIAYYIIIFWAMQQSNVKILSIYVKVVYSKSLDLHFTLDI